MDLPSIAVRLRNRIATLVVKIADVFIAGWRVMVHVFTFRLEGHYSRTAAYIQAIFVIGGLLYFRLGGPQPVGVAIACLGFAAVVVAVRTEHLKITEKVIWILIAFLLFGAEIQAIYHDRDTHDAEQRQARKESESNFQHIADGITRSITQSERQFQAEMSGLKNVIANTEKKARLQSTRVHPFNPDKLPGPTRFDVNVYFNNFGDEAATNVVTDAQMYVGPSDDIHAEKQIGKQFDKWWNEKKHWSFIEVAPNAPQPEPFFTIPEQLTEDEIQSITEHKTTLYVLIRWTYRDHLGQWITDECYRYQDLTRDFNISKQCNFHRNPKYALKLSH